MRILVISQYFWPETFRVNDIVKYLKKNNHHVDVLTGVPNYPQGKLFDEYKLDKKKFSYYYGASIFRIPVFLRRDGSKIFLFLNYISFVLSSIIFGFFLLKKRKYDIVFSFATSPLTSSLSALFFSKIKSCKSFIWVLDLWPDIILELGIIKNKILYGIVSFISEFIYKKFDYILVQSKSFQRRINRYNNNNIYFPAWAENLSKSNTKLNKYFNDKSFKIIFTGNVGEAQNFDKVLEAARILKNQNDIKWIIVGTGRELISIKKRILSENIKNFILEGKKTLNEISYYHSIADVLFISLRSQPAISATIPGKLQTYLNTNKFILGMISGEAKTIIEESGMGCCVDPNSPVDLAKKILYLKNHPEIIQNTNNSHTGKEYLNKHFNKDLLLKSLLLKLHEAYDGLEKIRLIRDVNEIPYNRNFSLSGLNLAFLGYLNSNDIKLHDNLINWPDGFFKSRFYDKSIAKLPGSNVIANLKVPDIIQNIYVIGSLTEVSKKFLIKKFYNFKIRHIDVPYDSVENIYKFCPKNFTDKDLILCTLPTPKQEQLSELIVKNNKNYKIICVGGAVSIASGEEKKVPDFIEKLNLEFLWRLRTDTRRRLIRLFYTFYFYLKGEITFRYNRIKFINLF